ncbi:MAG: hypothetical protein JEY96_19060 [Bacteroidales bacterium]|nr:hypothetical protein [Bacteroidales bacterium]
MKRSLKLIKIFIFFILCVGCQEEEVDSDLIKIPFTERNFNMGIVPIPLDWSEKEIDNAFKLSKNCGEIVSLSQKVGWNFVDNIQLYKNDIDLAANYELETMISIDVLNDERTGIGNLPEELIGEDFSNDNLRQLYKNEVIQIVESYKPKYINLALEINGYYLTNPEDFFNFISLYNEVYDALKVINSELIIAVTFQYEILNSNLQWDLLSAFENKLDVLCLTTYPDLFNPEYKALPSNYYSILENIKNIPIVYTEIGWQGNGNEIDEKLQAKFLIDFINQNESFNVELIIWSLLHDWNKGGDFETMGLLDLSGRKKEAWNTWTEIFNL